MVSQCLAKKKGIGRTRKHVKNPINLTLRSKFKVVSGSWMYATHRLMGIHPCAKYDKPISNHKKVMGRTRICTDRRTDRRTEWFLYTPLNFVRGGYNNYLQQEEMHPNCHLSMCGLVMFEKITKDNPVESVDKTRAWKTQMIAKLNTPQDTITHVQLYNVYEYISPRHSTKGECDTL